MTWFILALISSFFFIVYNLLGRVLAIDSKNPRAFSIVYNTLSGIIVLFLFIFDPGKWQIPPPGIIFLTLVTIVLYGIFNRVEYYAKKYIETSTLQILGKLIPAITFVTSIIFLKESVSLGKIIAAILILGGTLIAIYNPKDLQLKKGLGYALILCFSLGLAWTVDKVASPYYPLPFYALLGYTVSNVFVMFFPTLSIKSLKDEFRRTNWKIILLAAVNVGGYYSLIKAFQYGEASKVVLVESTSGIVTILAGIILLKEHNNWPRKILAGIIVFFGVLLLK